MAVYEYTARDEAGTIFSGIYEDIGGVSALKRELAKIGYNLVNAKRKRIFNPRSVRIKQADVIVFVYKFAGMCSAGLSIIQCLDTLEKQTENESLKFIINDIKKNIETGSSLTGAFEKYRYVFSDFFLGMVEAGESGGRLAESLEISTKYLERRADIQNRLKSAFIYPVIVIIVCFMIITALVAFVVPVFSKIYRQLGVPLPGPTQMLLVLSIIVRKWWPALIVLAVVLSIACRYIRKNKFIKSKWDHFKFVMPVFGKLNRLATVSHYVRSLAMLITTGVPIIKAFEVSSMVANNVEISRITLDMQKSVQAGNSVAESLEKHKIFPPIIVQLADSGEEAGMLGQMLNKGVDFLEKDVERITNSLLVKLEPALTLGMGAVIGLILLAVYLPMFDYMAHLK
ncbi:MAG: type II secretion system F family protein [Phycisphaerae bacterium]|nr:type II secretion system F family protein [Phycisphaerae bacterium]